MAAASVSGKVYWDILRLTGNIEQEIWICEGRPESMGIDTWRWILGFRTGAGPCSPARNYREDVFNRENTVKAIAFWGGELLIFRKTCLANLVYNPLFRLYRMKNEEASRRGDLFAAGLKSAPRLNCHGFPPPS
ncbi:MAG: hypothetical protein LBO80_08720 [Treponema sp.]|jgi:hypothetical protein|nr:hypothetical protein [Treponema sp.]